MRCSAARGLGVIGVDAAQAVALLIAALGDEYPQVRGTVVQALRALTRQDYGQDPARWTRWWKEQP